MEGKMINRRKAITMLSLGSAGLLTQGLYLNWEKEKHIITLSFDDGFEKSTLKTVELFEKYSLSACINVIATANLKNFKLPNEYHKWPVGDFDLWNDLKRRGHEIMPHSYRHDNLTLIPFNEATILITKCLDAFSENLEGFRAEESIYNFAYNASTPELEEWLKMKVKAFRTGGSAINPLPYNGMCRLTCISKGPENIDDFLEESINSFLEGPSGWFIFNTHGVDDEGWGPISSGFLDELLDRLVNTENVEILPAFMALNI